jgi:hypothetical protein
VVAVRFTGFEAGAIAGVEHDFAGIGNGHDRAPDDVDELVFVGVPMALTGLSSRISRNNFAWMRRRAIARLKGRRP